MMSRLFVASAVLMGTLLSGAQAWAGSAATKHPNVLFIAIDDLNDWTGCLKGHPQDECALRSAPAPPEIHAGV